MMLIIVLSAGQTDSSCACAGVVREPGFWNAAKYGASASLQPLLLEDQRLNAAVTLGVQGGRQDSFATLVIISCSMFPGHHCHCRT